MTTFSVTRRIEGVVDLSITRFFNNFPLPADPLVLAEQYRIESALNWDDVFVPLVYNAAPLVVNLNGLRTKSVNPYQGSTGGGGAEFRDKIRVLYNATDVGLNDNDIHFLRIVPIIRGVDQTPGPILMVMPPALYRGPYLPLVLTGSTATPVTLRLPRVCSSIYARAVSGTVEIYFENTPFPVTLVNGSASEIFSNNNTSISTITLDGGGDVELSFALGPKTTN